MKNEEEYTVSDLIQAVRDLDWHKAKHKETESQLKSKRDAVKSFEEAELVAATKVAEAEARVKRIASKVK